MDAPRAGGHRARDHRRGGELGLSLYDERVVAAAEAEISGAIEEWTALDGEGAVVATAPAGAGKSYAIGTATLAARAAGMRVAIATPTNEQAFALVTDLAKRMPWETVTLVPRNDLVIPSSVRRPNVTIAAAKETKTSGIVVGTLNKFGDAASRGDLEKRDVLLIDEAYQANAIHYYAVGDLAPRHLLVGDSGQLAPFSTAPDADRWRGLDADPLLTAVDVILRNHPKTKRHRLPVTRRLDPRAVSVARAFYPDHAFDAAVLRGVRSLTLQEKGKGRESTLDAILQQACATGWSHVELPGAAVVSADPEIVALIARLARRLLEREPSAVDEESRTPRAVEARQIAVAVSHNDQKDAVRAALKRAGMSDVRVDTANKLQGLTFEVVFAWHPLAGMMEADEFHLDPGRLCVMLTRHRQACIVLGRASDRALVEGIPPATPSYVGWEANPALDGWYAHEAVFEALEPFRMSVSGSV